MSEFEPKTEITYSRSLFLCHEGNSIVPTSNGGETAVDVLWHEHGHQVQKRGFFIALLCVGLIAHVLVYTMLGIVWDSVGHILDDIIRKTAYSHGKIKN